VFQCPCVEEEQALEDRMIEQMEQPTTNGQHGDPLRIVPDHQEHAHTKGHYYVANLTDGGIGKHTFHIPLQQGQQGTQYHGHRSQHRDDQGHFFGECEHIKEQAHQDIDACSLDQYPGKHGRNGRGGRGMGIGQPGMEGHYGCLHSESCQEESLHKNEEVAVSASLQG